MTQPTFGIGDLAREFGVTARTIRFYEDRALIAALCTHAGEAGSPRVYWHTHETNLTAEKFYDTAAGRSGFIVYSKRIRPDSPACAFLAKALNRIAVVSRLYMPVPHVR
jgi:MerR-like DNA binding protein